jgi:hypothetical protein
MSDLPETSGAGTADVKPTGAAAAAMLAAGIGSLAMGIATTLAEASVGVHDALEWSGAVGPLSGKTIVAAAVFFLSWFVLYVALRQRAVNLTRIFWLTLVLVGLGVLGTLPTFFQLFAAE